MIKIILLTANWHIIADVNYKFTWPVFPLRQQFQCSDPGNTFDWFSSFTLQRTESPITRVCSWWLCCQMRKINFNRGLTVGLQYLLSYLACFPTARDDLLGNSLWWLIYHCPHLASCRIFEGEKPGLQFTELGLQGWKRIFNTKWGWGITTHLIHRVRKWWRVTWQSHTQLISAKN